MDHVFVPDGLVTRQEDVTLTLTNGSSMHGRIWMGLPHDRSRLSDFLNMGEEFFPLLIPGGIHLVRTDAVVKAVPLAPAPTGEEVTKEDLMALNQTFRESFEHAGGNGASAPYAAGLRVDGSTFPTCTSPEARGCCEFGAASCTIRDRVTVERLDGAPFPPLEVRWELALSASINDCPFGGAKPELELSVTPP